MKVLQISLTQGFECGIALFAETLADQLRAVGISVTTTGHLISNDAVDLVLLQHHDELVSDAEVGAFASSCLKPLVLFAHSEHADRFAALVQGLIAMCPGMLGASELAVPTYVFPHPAWSPKHLEARSVLRREFGLPSDRRVAGTNGFLKFERRLFEIASVLVVEAERRGWFIDLLSSPWRLASPGLLDSLQTLVDRYPGAIRVEHAFMERSLLNRRLQACDLLWCWTDAPSSPYASGVVSDQYASGTRMYVADKQQHAHVLELPNVVAGPNRLDRFIDGLVEEMARGVSDRHDPAPVSWANCADDLARFLLSVAACRESKRVNHA